MAGNTFYGKSSISRIRKENNVNQHYGTTGIKHALAMLLIMALEDAQHQRPNLQYISSQATPPGVSALPDAKWLRDLLPVVDPQGLRTDSVAAERKHRGSGRAGGRATV